MSTNTDGIMHIVVQVQFSTAPAEPNAPSHLFPGCGDDRAAFVVLEGEPTDDQLLQGLHAIDPCYYVAEYNPGTRRGTLGVVDGPAPSPGTRLSLIALSQEAQERDWVRTENEGLF